MMIAIYNKRNTQISNEKNEIYKYYLKMILRANKKWVWAIAREAASRQYPFAPISNQAQARLEIAVYKIFLQAEKGNK